MKKIIKKIWQGGQNRWRLIIYGESFVMRRAGN